MPSGARVRDRSRYEGRNLAKLLLALALPAILLYLGIVLAFVARHTQVTARQSELFILTSDVLFAFFVPVQCICAWRLASLVQKPASLPLRILRYGGMLVACCCFSYLAALALEAFAYDLLIRVRGRAG